MVGKIITKIIIITMILQFICVPISNAGFWDDIKKAGEDFISEGSKDTEETGVNQKEVDDTINTIYNALLALGVALSVIIGAALGIKFMVGSVEEQAKVKELLMPYVVGCIITFGAFGIWKVMMGMLSHV